MHWFNVTLGCVISCLVIHYGSGMGLGTDQLSLGCTSFGLSLYRQLAKQDGSNLFFSPVSIYTALSMMLLAARGATEDELERVLGRPGIQDIQALKSILDSFQSSPSAQVTVHMANALYYDRRRVSLYESFKHPLGQLFGAVPQELQFPKPEAAINSWLFRQTGGTIHDSLSPGAITPDTVLLLLNAVFFKGPWRSVFATEATRPKDFLTHSGTTVTVPTMARVGRYSVRPLGYGIPARVLELPFGRDDRFSLFVILPSKAQDMASVEDRLTPQILEEAMTATPQPSQYWVEVPRFTLQQKTSMKDALRALGLTALFSSTTADLSRMAPGPLVLKDVMHQALIEVNETGAMATAVTVLEVSNLMVLLPFTVDHPFLLTLRDNAARLTLFMGRVNDPTGQ